LARQTENLLKANAQLAEVREQLNRSERLAAVGQLVASVAHEVGTPLHSIAWHVQAVGEEAGATTEMKKRIEIIDGQLNRVVRIIQDLLSSTRQRKPEPAWLPADRLVSFAAALLEPAYRAKGVVLRIEAGEAVPMAWADSEKIHQVLVNLLTNALAATLEGGSVLIRTGIRLASPEEIESAKGTLSDPTTTMVTISVSDTGCGMPEEDLQKAFTPFFTTKAIGKGTGLGLYLSREIVQAHGGTLSIESAVGKGTTVVVSLPGLHSVSAAVA
jgi:signal transduction histidine kinase